MYIWKITQTAVGGYDTYDSAVVVAESPKLARETHPGESDWGLDYTGWCKQPENVTAVCVGKATDDQVPGVICASFNAG